ncbi:MlaD family protein [Patulibacter minatonensis]|uniref:MlaD family protein n=1 Tax=Patulibacter minatonensis TaxID=298163 RepID=UPI00056281C1|nr:MlaD family protein [Patulibacter minatonensis]
MSTGGPRRRGSLAATPGLIGAVTVLIAIVGVVLAYNAGKGVPFVKTYVIRAEVPDASGLLVGNDVRKGGSRIGFVSDVIARPGTDGTDGATLVLKLDESARPLPADSRVEVRPRSVLGLKYVQLTAGRSRTMLADRQTIDLRYAGGKPVELDDLFNTFDAPTRRGASDNLLIAGTALAGRGAGINRAVVGLNPLLEHAEPALRTLADPGTALSRFFPALERTAAEVAPVATQQAGLVTGLRRTLGGLSTVRPSIQDAISAGPAALDAGTRELPRQAAFLAASTELFRRLQPGLRSLSHAAPGLATAFRAGTPALRRAPALNRRAVPALRGLQAFGTDDDALQGFAQLGATATAIGPAVAYVGPAQTRCNYLTLLTRNLASVLSESDTVGSALRTGLLITPIAPNGEAGPAATPADGPAQNLKATPPKQPSDSLLHSNTYPYTASPGQPAECEAGNERYVPGKQMIGNTPANEGLITEGQKVGAK